MFPYPALRNKNLIFLFSRLYKDIELCGKIGLIITFLCFKKLKNEPKRTELQEKYNFLVLSKLNLKIIDFNLIFKKIKLINLKKNKEKIAYLYIPTHRILKDSEETNHSDLNSMNSFIKFLINCKYNHFKIKNNFERITSINIRNIISKLKQTFIVKPLLSNLSSNVFQRKLGNFAIYTKSIYLKNCRKYNANSEMIILKVKGGDKVCIGSQKKNLLIPLMK